MQDVSHRNGISHRTQRDVLHSLSARALFERHVSALLPLSARDIQ